MNYIKQLQAELAEKKEALRQIEQKIIDFKVFLASSKFTGTDLDGGRKDWISTNDVNDRLNSLRRLAIQLIELK